MSQPSLTLRAWTFLWVVFGLAASLTVVVVPQREIMEANWPIFAILVLLACVTQFIEARFGRQTYTPHLAPFFAGLLLLPPILFVLLVLIPHLLEWIQKRLINSEYLRVWYLQPFNIATHIVAGLSAQILIAIIEPLVPEAVIPGSIVAVLAGLLLYVGINHYLIGQALAWARGIDWSDSHMWSKETLAPDIAMTAVGYVIAILWDNSPWLIIPALAPLGLMFQAMKVPQLQQQARTDEKTGLLNARHFKERFADELLLADRFNRPLSVVMVDLDLLRDINNSYGHLAGDVVIVGIAAIIRSEIRDYDIAARFGGEEYAILLPNTTVEVARTVAEGLRRIVEETVFYTPNTGVEMKATISLGVASMTDGADTMENLIHEADVALYQAKYRGRNRVICAAEVPHSFKLDYTNHLLALPTDTGAQTDTMATKESQLPGSTHARQLFTTAESAHMAARSGTPSAFDRDTRQKVKIESVRDSKSEFSSTSTNTRAISHPLFVSYLIFVIGGALLVTAWTLWHAESLPLGKLLAFAVMAVLAEALNVNMYTKATVSTSATVSLAALLLVGLPGAIAVSSAIAIVHFVRQRPPIHRAFFNWSIHIWAGIIPTWIFSLSPFPLEPVHALSWGAICIAAMVPYFLTESGLIAVAIALNDRGNVISVWREHFGWLVLHYIVMSILSVFIGLAYASLGLWGLIGFVFPVFLIHQSQKMYVERTERSVAELHRMNSELQTANHEVERASQEIHTLNVELLEMLGKIIDARDPETSGHALNVARYAVAIGNQLNLKPQQIEHLRWSGMLHDIGKLGVPEKILLKAAALTEEEYTQVKKHAALGGALLETVHGLSHLAPFVRHHHERWDGKGYPAGLAGEQIPFEARVLAVCDAAEAMAAIRPYKTRFTTDQIVEELHRCAGSQFDPTITDAFIQVLPLETFGTLWLKDWVESGADENASVELPTRLQHTSIRPYSLQPSQLSF